MPPKSDEEGAQKNKAGYEGYCKILDQLIWPDLQAASEHRSAIANHTRWDLARTSGHPWGVYVGPTIPQQRKAWREITSAWQALLKETNTRIVQVAIRDEARNES